MLQQRAADSSLRSPEYAMVDARAYRYWAFVALHCGPLFGARSDQSEMNEEQLDHGEGYDHGHHQSIGLFCAPKSSGRQPRDHLPGLTEAASKWRRSRSNPRLMGD